MNGRLLFALAALTAFTACGHREAPPDAQDTPAAHSESEAAPAAPGTPVTLDREHAEALDLVVAPARSVRYRRETQGYATVWSHETIAQLAADLATAEAASRQSAAALARLQGLATTPGAFPGDLLDTATRQAATDSAALQLAHHKVSALLGDAPGATAHLHDWARGHLKLVRVTFPTGASIDRVPEHVRLVPLAEPTRATDWRVQAVWEAPADPAVPGYSLWVSASGVGLAEGSRLLGWAANGTGTPGVLVPASALVVSDDQTWCFIEHPKGTYTRVAVSSERPMDGGYVVTTGVAAGDAIVVHGAGLLLARMMGAAADTAP